MSQLAPKDKAFLEKLFGMEKGYVLNFSDATLGDFIASNFNIDIHADRYTTYGTSKAKKLRDFWRLEPDAIVSRSITLMIEQIESNYIIYNTPEQNIKDDEKLIEKCKGIAIHLSSSNASIIELKKTFTDFDGKYLSEQILRMEKSVNDDPSLAIGTAKELLETCCKTILSERNIQVNGNPDIPTLTKQTLKELKLIPDEIPEQAKGSKTIKRLLSNLSTISSSLAELRNLYGTGHGKHGTTKGLSPRHARLAVGSVATLTTFLYETHKETM